MTDAVPSDVILSPVGILPVLQKWFGDEMVRIWSAWPTAEPPWVVASCAVWGSYVQRFVDFCVPTMLAPENVKALAPCWIMVYTDPTGWPVVWEAMHRLEPHGIKLILQLMPEAVLDAMRAHDSNRYWGLSVAQNLGMRVSGHVGAGYHMLMPDHLYGPRYFPNLKRLGLGHDIVAQTGVSATMDVLQALQQFRHPNGWIDCPDRTLGTLAWTNLHPQTRAYVMNRAEPPDAMPGAHFLCWQGRDAIHTYCCHQNASWLSPRVCVAAPNFIPATIDTRLPFFAGDFYVPTPADEMTFIEFSGDNKASQEGLVDADTFHARCWSQVGFSERYQPYFYRPSLTPIEPQVLFMTDKAIARQHKRVADQLHAARPPAWMAKLQQFAGPAL